MKNWLVAAACCCALGSAAQSLHAGPFTSHDDLVHDLAHYGAGTIAAETAHLLIRRSDLSRWQRVAVEAGAACVSNMIYESITKPDIGHAEERCISGTLGGLVFGLAINIKWGGRPKPAPDVAAKATNAYK
jgi:hypothetical protein